MKPENFKLLNDALDWARDHKVKAGIFTAADVAECAMEALALQSPAAWAEIRDQMAREAMASRDQRRTAAFAKRNDPRQEWLDCDEYKAIPAFLEIGPRQWIDTKIASGEQYEEAIRRKLARLQSNGLRSAKLRKREELSIKDMQKQFARLWSLLQQGLGTAEAQQKWNSLSLAEKSALTRQGNRHLAASGLLFAQNEARRA